MKAISAIIAIILILMIVVAIAALSYTWFTGIFTSTTETAEESIEKTTESMLAQMKIESISAGKVYVRNTGQTDLTEVSIYVNDEPADFNMTPPVVGPGEVGTVSLYDFVGEEDTIKITSSGGSIVSKTAPDPCSDSSVVLCLKFDEGSGTIAQDSSKYGNDGTLYNNTTVCSGGDCPTWVNGKYGKALEFDGVDDYIEIPYDPSLFPYTGSWTVTGWIKSQGDSAVIVGTNYSRDGWWQVWLEWGEIWIEFFDGTNSVDGRFIPGSTIVNDGNWHYFAVVRDKSINNFTLYIDGIHDGTDKIDITGNIINFNSTYIGTYVDPTPEQFFNGTIDEIIVYKKAIY
ncbi:MAG: hypothetical protein GTN36_06335 [Candidatus Aenigmarchaeota archaeon]|nr:hypothetical protein [Candidatus Aenigmarchaeota archaeon]